MKVEIQVTVKSADELYSVAAALAAIPDANFEPEVTNVERDSAQAAEAITTSSPEPAKPAKPESTNENKNGEELTLTQQQLNDAVKKAAVENREFVKKIAPVLREKFGVEKLGELDAKQRVEFAVELGLMS